MDRIGKKAVLPLFPLSCPSQSPVISPEIDSIAIAVRESLLSEILGKI
jgi:hypothetical protein